MSEFDDLGLDEDGVVGVSKMAHTSDGQARPNDDSDAYNVMAEELRQFVERIEQLEVEKKDIADQIKEVFAESKSRGYDTKAIRRILSVRKKKADVLREEKAIVQIYGEALGIDEDLL